MSRRALVTGGGARLGRAMSEYLGARGFDVAVHHHRSGDGAREVVEAIRQSGRTAAAVQADLLDETETEALVGRAAEALGGSLDLLVNNASIFEHDTLASADMESWHRHVGSNLRAPFQLTQAFAAQAPGALRDAGGEPRAAALVVNMVDQRVLKPTPEFMTYTIAKMGLWAFTQTAAQALAPGIRVNAIGPGPTLRGIRQSPEHFERQRVGTILERGSNPEDIVGALGYFIDSPGVTGQLICADGGQHLAWRTPDIVGLD